MTSLSLLATNTPSMAWRYALAFFLVVVAIGLVYLLVKAGKVLGSLKKMVIDLDTEMVPLLEKLGTTVDEVNQELDKVNEITGSVVGITQRIDSTTQSVGSALSKPAKKAAAFTAGAQQAVSSFVSRFRGGASPEAGERTYSPPVYQEPPAAESAAPAAGEPPQAAGPAPEAAPMRPPDEPPAQAAEGEPS
jgi:uncharacterized protein YoxC